MTLRFPLALLVAAAACGSPSGPGEPVDLGGWLMAGGLRRTYTLHLPPSYDDAVPTPVLIVFHGAGDTGFAFEIRSSLDPATDAGGVVTVFPDGVQGSWGAECDCTAADLEAVDDVEFTRALIAHLADTVAVDPQRIYVAGYSQGGLLVHLLACELADQLAGAASVAATIAQPTADRCAPARPVPMVFVHGTQDAAFPWSGLDGGLPPFLSIDASVAEWVRHNECGATPEREDLPDRTADGTLVRTERYTGCGAGSEVLLYAVEGGGHTWPGGAGSWPAWAGRVSAEIDAGEEIVRFFAAHPGSQPSASEGPR